jgi:uncharacterized protein YbjT (DUF2867 family)
MSQTAIIFGATGLTGNHLLYELLEEARFTSIKVFTRRPLPIASAMIEQVIVEDFDRLDQYASKIVGDVVFCCLGTTIKKAGSKAAFEKADLGYPLEIAKIAQTNKVPNLIVISSIGADAASSTFYLNVKGRMEQQIRAAFTGNLKFLRPSMLLGDRKEFRLGEVIGKYPARLLSFLMIGPLSKYRAIESITVARAMIKAISLPHEKIFIESDQIARM